jgi:protein-S-isoprenylcysteine O-methyltransferase Ste14
MGFRLSMLELKIPPALLMILFGAAMWWLSRLFGAVPVQPPWRFLAVLVPAAVGACLLLAAAVHFRKAETTVNPTRPDSSSSLVTGGVYRFTRNPMYLAFALFLLAWAAFLSSLQALVLVPLYIAWLNRFQIRPEEMILESRFGKTYRSYSSRVRRWL